MESDASLARSIAELLTRAFAADRPAPGVRAGSAALGVPPGGDVLTVTIEGIGAEGGRGLGTRLHIQLAGARDAHTVTSRLVPDPTPDPAGPDVGAQPANAAAPPEAAQPAGGGRQRGSPRFGGLPAGAAVPREAWHRDASAARAKVLLRHGDLEVLDEVVRGTAEATGGQTSRSELLRALVEAVDVAGVGGVLADFATHAQRVAYLAYKLRR